MSPATVAVAVIVVGMVAVPLVMFRLLYLPLALRVFEQVPWLKAKAVEPAAEHEECRFQTVDGATLHGSYLATSASERLGVILFCHELSGDRWSGLPYAEPLRRAGFDIFTFDFRNHGASDTTEHYEPIFWATESELQDVEAALGYLAGRPDADPRGVGLIGVSRGASTALCAAARNPRVRAVVTDGAFPTKGMLVFLIRRYMSIYTRMTPLYRWLPNWYLGCLMNWTRRASEARRGCRYLNVERYARQLRQPVLMIHGADDTYIAASVVHAFKEQIGGPTELWIVPKAKHNRCVYESPDEYARRTCEFFRRHLTAAPNLTMQGPRSLASRPAAVA